MKIHFTIKTKTFFVMFVGNSFHGQTTSFGICWGDVFSQILSEPFKTTLGFGKFCKGLLQKFQMLSQDFAFTQQWGFSNSLRSVKNPAK